MEQDLNSVDALESKSRLNTYAGLLSTFKLISSYQ